MPTAPARQLRTTYRSADMTSKPPNDSVSGNASNGLAGATPLWRPSDARRLAANITAYMHWLSSRRGLTFGRYEDLWRWSVDNLEEFWTSTWDFFEVGAHPPFQKALFESKMPGARWFEGSSLNLVDYLSRHQDLETPAIVFDSEAAGNGSISWPELLRHVGATAASLQRLGVQRGDRVAAYLPNVPQAVIAILAVASIGGIWSITAPDMGPTSVAARFSQIKPKVLFAVDGYRFGGKAFDRRNAVHELLAALPSVEAVIWIPLLDRSVGAPVFDGVSTVVHWDDVLSGNETLAPILVPFDHPLWILYSSGTTGVPKGIVHGHGGVLLNSLVLLSLHCDISPKARLFWISSTSWVVWNLHVLGLLCGATLCMYDGSPTGAGSSWEHLWKWAATNSVSHFGAGAAFYESCLKADVDAAASGDLSALRALYSTGSPLSEGCYRWVYRAVKGDVWLASMSGGTDIAGAFLAGNPTLPVIAGEMQCRVLGAAVEAFDEHGRPLESEVGELVCTHPIPSMPLYFWNDPNDERYIDSYFRTYADARGERIWRHGDWLRLTPRPEATAGTIFGRSDATINRHGIRTGSSDFYRVVEALSEVTDSLIVDVGYLGRESLLALFVVLRPGLTLSEEVERRIADAIRSGLSPRHLPDKIFQVVAVPRTLTGKKLELPIKKLLLGYPIEAVTTRDALANPESIDWFIELARTRNDEGRG